MSNPSDRPANAGAETRPRVLVADDSRVMRLAIKKILGSEFDLVPVENGAQAWEQLCRDPTVQALVTDIEMPGLDGYELICRIRAAEDERVRELPVITITGAEDETTKQRAYACGATDFITKPLDSIQLLARVQAYVRYDRATRELTEQSANLEEQSIADLLTGLPSRRYLLQRGEQDIAFARRRGRDLVLIRIDIDGFKQLYRTLGDEGSDRLLAWVAKILMENARAEDTVARIAGAEFALHANGIGLTEAQVVCERIRTAVTNKPFTDGAHSVSVTLCLGVASLGQDNSDSLESLLRLANQRLMHARSEGGNRVCSSILGEAAAQVEELTLDAPTADSVVETEVLSLDSPDEHGLSDEPLEIPALPEFSFGRDVLAPVRAELPDVPGTDRVEENPNAPSVDLISVDKALLLVEQGQGDRLLPYLEGLMRQVQPLLDLYRRRLKR